MSERVAMLPPPVPVLIAEADAEEQGPARDTLPMVFGGDVERRFEKIVTASRMGLPTSK